MPRTNSESDFGGSITSDESDVEMGPSHNQATTAAQGASIIEPTSITVQKLNVDTRVNPTGGGIPPANGVKGPGSPTQSPQKAAASKSPRSPLSARPLPIHESSFSNLSKLRGAARFRATVRKVMAMRKTSTYLGAFRGAGAEPGIDPRRPSAVAAYGHLKESCSIQVVDFNSVRAKFREFDNKGFVRFLEENHTDREEWVKVRWIAIGGISWDVISSLALVYDLHPLALEDVLHRHRGNIRSKADYYAKHLFVRVLCHSLGCLMDAPRPRNITDAPRSSSPGLLYDSSDKIVGESLPTLRRRVGLFNGSISRKSSPSSLENGSMKVTKPVRTPKRKKTESTDEALAALELLKRGQRVPVDLKNLFMFLLRDGTLISIHQTPTDEFTGPIMSRLRTRDTVLRSTADPSLLLESLLDLVVDQAVEVAEEYQKTIFKLERDILLKPKMNSVRRLHILSGDLSSHKRTLEPLKALIYGLRRYDLDRCIAVAAAQGEDMEDSVKVVGYISHKSKVYLADVHDHVEYILSSLDLFVSVAENLINFTFNTASYQMNQTMRMFTLVTIIFLPLTFLSGYFGMNFQRFDAILGSDVFFWEIALPILAVILPVLFFSDLIRLKHYVEKKTLKHARD